MVEGGLTYETLRAIVEHASDGVFVTDGDLRIVWVNAAACALTDRTAGELIGHTIPEFIIADELAARPIAFDELRAGRNVITIRTFGMRDGSRRVLEVSAKMVGDHLLGIARDATARLAAQQRLTRSEADFRALIDRSPDAIIVHRGGVVRYANAACKQILGWPSAAWGLGRPAIDIVHPDERARALARIRSMHAGEESVPWAEERLLRADGTVVVAVVGAMRIDFEGEPSIVVTARDVTEVRRMSEQLAQADRLASLGTLAAGVAHEINNPLTYVLLHLDSIAAIAKTLASVTSYSARLHEHAESALEGARRVARIVRDLRAFSRTDDDASAVTDVQRPIEVALSTASHELKHRARVECHFGEVPRVRASEGRVAQIMLNLLLNAGQAIPEGHPERNTVTVTTTAEAGEVRIAITDTGVGIGEDNRRRIFEPFFTTKKVGEGSGLGLSICHGLVTALGGRIEVESTVGVGSTFTVVLPAQTPLEPARAPASPPPADVARRTRILFIDDEAAIGFAVARAFEDSHEVVQVTSGAAAIERLQRDADFDVVVCDMAMPAMTGAELHAWMREHVPGLSSRTLFITGGRISERERKLGEPWRWLDKPFTLDAFEAALTRLLAQSS